jgi:hypothetical protein
MTLEQLHALGKDLREPKFEEAGRWRCKSHPRYRAKGKPRLACEGCWWLWFVTQGSTGLGWDGHIPHLVAWTSRSRRADNG